MDSKQASTKTSNKMIQKKNKIMFFTDQAIKNCLCCGVQIEVNGNEVEVNCNIGEKNT